MNKFFIFLFLTIIAFSKVNAQDSLTQFSSQQLELWIKLYHPMVKRSIINTAVEQSLVTSSRGAFNPVLSYQNGNKTFNSVNYYQYQQAEVKLPTWFGIEMVTGAQQLNGNYTDPMLTIGSSSYTGIQIPLLKNLLMDKRRHALAQSKIMVKLSENEQRIVINELLKESIEIYWLWVKEYYNYKNAQVTQKLSAKRLEMVKNALVLGEATTLDTLEAFTQYQLLLNLSNQFKLQFQKTGWQLSVYLWDAKEQGVNIPENIIPADSLVQNYTLSSEQEVSKYWMRLSDSLNPELNYYNIKNQSLRVDKQLKRQELLPKLDFNYAFLRKTDFPALPSTPLFQNNYQYGLKAEMPLFLSTGRGEFKAIQNKIAINEIDLNWKRRQVELKINSYLTEIKNIKEQVSVQQAIYQNYLTLTKAEEAKFFNGEGSLFLINTRESKAIEAAQKLIDLQVKYQIALSMLNLTVGAQSFN